MTKARGHKAGSTYSTKSQQWASQVLSISENTRQGGIEIRFDAEPSPSLQPKLRVMGFRHSRTRGMWYSDKTDQARQFAEQLKKTLPVNADGPSLQLSPSGDAVKANLEKKAFSFIMFTLMDGQTKSYVVFEPSKPRAEVIAANFAAEAFGDKLLAIAVLPRTHIREARILFDEGKIIYPAGPPDQMAAAANKKNAMSYTGLYQNLTDAKVPVQNILLTTEAVSREPDFSAGVELHTWKEANAYVKSKIGKHISDVYYKVQWKNADHFGGMVDLEPSEFFDHIDNPLSNHITTYLTNYSRTKPQDPFYDKELVDYAKHLLDTCLFGDVAGASDELKGDTSHLSQEPLGHKVSVQTILLTTIAEEHVPDFANGIKTHTWEKAEEFVNSKTKGHSDVFYNVLWSNGSSFAGFVPIPLPTFYEDEKRPLASFVKADLKYYVRSKGKHSSYISDGVNYCQRILDTCMFDDIGEVATKAIADGERNNIPEMSDDEQRRQEREALDRFYKWAVHQEDLSVKPAEVTLERMTKWFRENVPELSSESISTIWKSHQRILKSLERKIKRKNPRAPFDSIYKKILKVIPGVIGHIKAGKTTGKSKVDPDGGLMALNYDFKYYDKNGYPIIALSHYFRQNGDPIADPDMEIRLMPDLEVAEALTYQDRFSYQEVYREDEGKQYVFPKLKKDLNKFLNQWLTNIIHQGHRIDLSNDNEGMNGDQEKELWDLIHKVLPDLKLEGEQQSKISINDDQRHLIQIALGPRGYIGNFNLDLKEIAAGIDQFRASVLLKPEKKGAETYSLFMSRNPVPHSILNADPETLPGNPTDDPKEMNANLMAWLGALIDKGNQLILEPVLGKETSDTSKDNQNAGISLTKMPMHDPRGLSEKPDTWQSALNAEQQKSLRPGKDYEILYLLYHWLEEQDDGAKTPEKLTREEFTSWMAEHFPAIDGDTQQQIWQSHQSIRKSVDEAINAWDLTDEVKIIVPLSGTPVFNPQVMARLIHSQNYLLNAWGLSHPKNVIQKKTFNPEEITHLQAFFAIYVMEDRPMQASYLSLYREQCTEAVNLTFQETGTPLPNVLVPAGTREPFHSHNWRAYDMRSLLQNSFASLVALTNEKLNQASPLQLYELAQLGNPSSYRIAVSQEKLINIWRTRGKKLFDELGLPTNLQYPYADLIAGYENMMSLRDLLNDGDAAGDEWWIAAALYRPVADLGKAQVILDEMLNNKMREKQSYLSADGQRPRPNYKHHVDQVDRTIQYLEESRAVLQAYLHHTTAAQTDQSLQTRKDHLADGNGLYTERSAGDKLQRIKIPMPPEAQYEAEVTLVSSFKGYKIGLSASKNFGSETYQGLLPRQTNESFLSREQALEAALEIHAGWLKEMLASVNTDKGSQADNRRRILLALESLTRYAERNGLTLNTELPEADEGPAKVRRDPLTNDSGVYTIETAGDNLEEIEIPMPKTAQYTAEIQIAKTSGGTYIKGISAIKNFGDYEGYASAPSIFDRDFQNRNEALRAALLEHEERLERLLESRDSILNNEEKKNKQLSMALKAVIDFAHNNGIELDVAPPKEREQANQVVDQTGNIEENSTNAVDPLADEDGIYNQFTAGENFETLIVPMPKSAGYHAEVFLVKTSAGNYRQGILHTKQFGDVSYSASFPETRTEAYSSRKAALKAALLHHEQELEIQLGRKDTILNNEASKHKRLMLAMKALYQFAEENRISMKAVPEKDEGIIPGLEAAYWMQGDSTDEVNKIIVGAQAFHQARLRELIGTKLEALPISTLEEIRAELAARFRERRPFSSYEQGLLTVGKKGNDRKASLIAAYIDDIIIDHDLRNKEHAPVMSILLDMLFSGSARLVDKPLESQSSTKKDKPMKKQSQHELNQEIEAFIDEKDRAGAYYDEKEKNYLRQYTGSGGLLALGATGRGTLYEFYTPDGIVKKMWDIAYHYGYDGGSILEPAVGTGNFLRYAPKHAEVFAFETNHYACRVAQILYPNAHIQEKAFETHFFAGNIHLKDKFQNPGYSLVIGNPPYGTFNGKYAGLGEKRYTGVTEYDQYFTLRSLDLLRPGGLLVFLIPSFFMLSTQKYNKTKEKISAKAEWVDAYRFPEGAFPNTSIGTDILVLRKRQ